LMVIFSVSGIYYAPCHPCGCYRDGMRIIFTNMQGVKEEPSLNKSID
jgi:hypothetical protein